MNTAISLGAARTAWQPLIDMTGIPSDWLIWTSLRVTANTMPSAICSVYQKLRFAKKNSSDLGISDCYRFRLIRPEL
jgi:hypothetical protein